MRLILLFIISCVVLPLSSCATAKREPQVPLGPATFDLLQEVRLSVLSWSEECGVWKTRVMAGCDDGDATLFNALLCMSGDDVACKVVAASQDDDGRFWRNPHVRAEDKNSFSRDMFIGVVAWLSNSKDKAAAEKYVGWMKANKKLCHDDTDGRCRFTPMTIALWNYLADKDGWSKLPYSLVTAADPKPGPIVVSEDPAVSALDRLWEGLEPTTPAGFPLHLLAAQILIKHQEGDWNGVLQKIAERLVAREPKNMFFLYLKTGGGEELGQAILKFPAPKENPGKRTQWCWQRTDSEEAWKDAAGWDWVFVIGLAQASR